MSFFSLPEIVFGHEAIQASNEDDESKREVPYESFFNWQN